jgi:putative flippase GtrA
LRQLLSTYQTNRRELERFAKFMVVGVIGAVVDFGVYNLLNEAAGLAPEISGSASFILAICSNFLWNRFWTYPDSRTKPIVFQFVQFFIVNVLGIVIRVPIIALTRSPFARLSEQFLRLDPTAAATVGNNLALALAVFIVLFWNFFVNRFWTYSDVGSWGEAASAQERAVSPSSGSVVTQESK